MRLDDVEERIRLILHGLAPMKGKPIDQVEMKRSSNESGTFVHYDYSEGKTQESAKYEAIAAINAVGGLQGRCMTAFTGQITNPGRMINDFLNESNWANIAQDLADKDKHHGRARQTKSGKFPALGEVCYAMKIVGSGGMQLTPAGPKFSGDVRQALVGSVINEPDGAVIGSLEDVLTGALDEWADFIDQASRSI